MRLHKLLEAKLPKLNGLSVMSLDDFVNNKKERDIEENLLGVAEGSEDIGDTIRELYQQIYDQGDDALEYLNTHAENFARYWDRFEGDLDSMIEELPTKILAKLAQELQMVAGQEGLTEAPMLGANYRKFDPKDMQDYLGRVKDKKKLKTDKYKMPFVHGSNIEIKNEQDKEYDLEKLRAAITQRPKQLLKQNEKMEHSDGSTSIFFNVGLPALKGLAVNEETGDFVIVDTCPGAGACQTYCYAMKGGYIQWKASSMAQTRVLNFLLNDPEGFKKMMAHELGQAERKYGKKGTKVVVRWHDAGDFFSNEYLDVAYAIAQQFPDIDFYAYTKMGDIANAPRPSNFKMNFSQGAKRGQELKVDIKRTKHSKVVPRDLFYDLIAREGSSLIKDSKGRTQFKGPGELDEFKDRLAKKYAIDKSSIITYDKMMSTKDDSNPRWNVIVMPGDGDDSANRADVIGTYLLFH